ncbi:hypothetical protein FKM82_020644 [Ascaphus truei]|uniref:B2 bradykinin receptor n=1 Tax=Ascaphus truei TaxID=8439 RepID=UPI003F598142
MAMNTTDNLTTMYETINTSSRMMENSTVLSEKCTLSETFEWIFSFQPFFMWFIFVLGFIENTFVLAIFLLHKSRSTVAEIYLGNLATADLLFICGLPLWAINISNKFYWPFGSFLCITVNALIVLNLNASIYFMMMISIDRYLALVKTMSFGRMRRAGCAKWNCLLIWVFSVLISLPSVVFRTVTYVPQLNNTACIILAPSDNWFIVSDLIFNIVSFVIPMTVISYCTFQIIKVLKNNAMQKFKEINTETKATKLVFAVLFVFILCWLPFQIVTFVDMLYLLNVLSGCTVNNFIDIGTQISTYCGYSNSCINPLLYVIVGNHFRKKTKEVYKQFLSRSRNTASISSSLQMDDSSDTIRTSISMGRQQKNRI